jgi:hypothetical protein
MKETPKGNPFGRNRNSGQIEQIHKIRAIPEIRVQLHRLRGNLFVRVNGPGGGKKQDVHLPPFGFGCSFQFAKLVLRFEGIHRAEFSSTLDDAAHHGVHLIPVCVQEPSNRGQPRRHPGPRIEQRRRVAEGRIIDLDLHSA